MHFTGIAGPWDTTVTVSWWQGNGTTRPPGATLQMQVQKSFGGARYVRPPARAQRTH